MKKIFVYPKDIKSGIVIPASVDCMTYEEYDGEVRIIMFFKDSTQILANDKEDRIWTTIGYKIRSFPEYYRAFLDVVIKKLDEEKQKEINSTYTPLFIETDTPRINNRIYTEEENLKDREKSINEKEAVLHMVNQFNLLDLSELIEDRTHFEEALALLNNIGKRYRLSIYISGGGWNVIIGNNDSPYPSFSIALHVFLSKMEYYMTRGTRDPEYK